MSSVVALFLTAVALGVLVAGLHAVFNSFLGRDRATVSALWTLVFAPLAAIILALMVLGVTTLISVLNALNAD